VKFHDGSPFSSEDVKASYDRNSQVRRKGVASVRQGLVADIETIETPDPLTVIFKLKRPEPCANLCFSEIRSTASTAPRS